MLRFDGALRYQSPGEMPREIVWAVSNEIVTRIASQANAQTIYEAFKSRFAPAAGRQYNRSSNASWASSDLEDYMSDAASNAALFVDALHSALEDIKQQHPNVHLPAWSYVNTILAPIGYVIDPPNLIIGAVQMPIPVSQNIPSLGEQANARIQQSLDESDRLLSEGKNRLAVQEILWLLETISTAFQGSQHDDGTVTGKYFNKIVGDLRRLNKGRVLGEVTGWMEKLHGYLSSPSGGGVRHGAVLTDTYEMSDGEAALFCNLTRSYINYLLHEHKRLGIVV